MTQRRGRKRARGYRTPMPEATQLSQRCLWISWRTFLSVQVALHLPAPCLPANLNAMSDNRVGVANSSRFIVGGSSVWSSDLAKVANISF
ncbi:hypothetical protein [Leisingera aquaemixtae]|uniref:hypothetical protein n=1 Tax=Leisingera aquaemixtae TaxID=1396826 RepID=UPI0021A61CCB|nr:hypothetical protein [Leisingera aquaemixtae]UWQ44191.1 hypothetical protein K3719_10195 [Leisingera aquaemixtae]